MTLQYSWCIYFFMPLSYNSEGREHSLGCGSNRQDENDKLTTAASYPLFIFPYVWRLTANYAALR